jgi:glycosyltransferase involved in cell wall biosynthesis
MARRKSLRILGTRGIPAAHGGFETFAERLALYLTEKGWEVTVYCQRQQGEPIEDTWQGVHRVRFPGRFTGPQGTMVFDWRSVRHAARFDDPCLVLGYNTAGFLWPLRRRGIPLIINMDGMEWQREKWGLLAKTWLWLNEKAGVHLANVVIADHPEIRNHLSRIVSAQRIDMIPYGADTIDDADPGHLERWGVEPDEYLLLVARLEPENSIEEFVRAFSAERRGRRLLVIGPFFPSTYRYHRRLQSVASEEVVFPGVVYERGPLASLRRFARLYLHGHRVGGTNPSLVEALGAGSAILAHDNRFNRWVAADAARYFDSCATCERQLSALLGDDAAIRGLRAAARANFAERFTWDTILLQYEELLERVRAGG